MCHFQMCSLIDWFCRFFALVCDYFFKKERNLNKSTYLNLHFISKYISKYIFYLSVLYALIDAFYPKINFFTCGDILFEERTVFQNMEKCQNQKRWLFFPVCIAVLPQRALNIASKLVQMLADSRVPLACTCPHVSHRNSAISHPHQWAVLSGIFPCCVASHHH